MDQRARSITLEGAAALEVEDTLRRLAGEDIFGQLLRRDGKMARLAMEGDDVKLDWVDGVERALASPEQLRAAEQEGDDVVRQGVRHVIWSGMGGSVQTVYALKRMGYLEGPRLAVHPLDSTDPAALNNVLQAIGVFGGQDDQSVTSALSSAMMIGVSMGMTSEEPITHLAWFDGLLQDHHIPNPGSHIQVMTLPDSYLDQFARPRGARMVPIQLDGENHTPGRMSAPATRVFLRPVALLLAAAGAQEGGLRQILQRGQDLYALSHAAPAKERRGLTQRDPFVRLAAWLSLRADNSTRNSTRGGAPKLLVTLPPAWQGFAPWLEQLVEESLGKEGKGFLIFYGQSEDTSFGKDCAVLRIAVEGQPAPPAGPPGLPVLTLNVPCETLPDIPQEAAGLGEVAGLFLGFKKTVAAYGYLQDIVFAGQPAVEAYKKYARDLRAAPRATVLAPAAGASNTAGRVSFESLTLDYSSLRRRGLLDEHMLGRIVDGLGGRANNAADVFAAVLIAAGRAGSLRYLDLTWNGELCGGLRGVLDGARLDLANRALQVPAKVRTGPSDYHSTEQGETDGPAELVSLRLVAERHDPVAAGQYDDAFLLAQARGTWQAMEDAGRWIVFMTLPEAGQSEVGRQAVAQLGAFFKRAASLIAGRRLPPTDR